jgi:MFS family permease
VGLLGALLLVRFFDELIVFIPAGTLPQVADEFHLTYAQAGLLLSMFSAAALVGSLLTLAADHVSRRALASIGAAVVALCLLAFGISPWFAGLLVSVVVWGAAGDALASGAEVALVDVSGAHLTAALGRQNFLGAVGDLLSPVVLVIAGIAHIGWRALFVGASVLMGGYALWLRAEPIPPPTGEAETTVLGGVVEAVRDIRTWMLAAVEAALTVVDEPYLAFLILFLERAHGVPVALAALAAMADLGGSAVGSFFAPRLLRGHYRLWLVGCGFGIPAAISVLVVVPILPVQYAAAAFGGTCGAVVWVAVQAMSLGLRPGRAGTISAVISTIALPALAFPVVVGLVADHAGLARAMLVYIGVTGAAAFLLVPLSRLRRAAPVEEGAATDVAGGRQDL